MNDDRTSNWPAIVFFAASGVFFLACVWYLIAGTLNPEYFWQTPAAASAGQRGGDRGAKGRILLVKNQTVRIGDNRIVYRGIQDGALVMDLFILALDPHYGYPHRIDENRAHQGFAIGEYHFQLLAASDAKISLQRL